MILRAQAIDITWKQNCFFNVGQPDNLLSETVYAKAASTMWRQAMLESQQVMAEARMVGINALSFHLLDYLIVMVFTHWHSGNFHPPEE